MYSVSDCQKRIADEINSVVSKNGHAKQIMKKGNKEIEWIERINKFANKYFHGDIKKLTYCLKDVYNNKDYIDLMRTFKHVNYEEMYEENDMTNFTADPACAGGACLV